MDQNSFVIRNVDAVAPGCARPAQAAREALADQSQIIAPANHHRKKGRLTFVWGISGTVLSAVGFVALTLYQQYNDSLNELRRDLNHFHEVSGELVKKESLRKTREKLIDCLKELRDSAALRAQVERDLRASEEERKEMARELQRVREHLAAVEGRQSALAIVLPQLKQEKHNTDSDKRAQPGGDGSPKLSYSQRPKP